MIAESFEEQVFLWGRISRFALRHYSRVRNLAAVVVDPTRVDEIAGVLLDVLALDTPSRARRSTEGRAQAARFTWRKTAEETIAASGVDR